MTHAELERLVREWQRRLNIPHWRVTINWDKPEDPGANWATITRDGEVGFYETAEMTVASNFHTWSLQDANEVVVHELMHMLMHDLQFAGESAVEVMSAGAYKLFSHRFMHELEGVVDKLALLAVQFAGPFDPTVREETTHVLEFVSNVA